MNKQFYCKGKTETQIGEHPIYGLVAVPRTSRCKHQCFDCCADVGESLKTMNAAKKPPRSEPITFQIEGNSDKPYFQIGSPKPVKVTSHGDTITMHFKAIEKPTLAQRFKNALSYLKRLYKYANK